MDLLDEIGISDSGPSHESEAKKRKKNDGKVNMYETEFVKAKEINTDSFEKEGHTFMVHVFPGDDDVSEVTEQIVKIAAKLKEKGYIYRCDAGSDDVIAKKLVKVEGLKKEVFLPFKKFNEDLADDAILTNTYELPYRYAAQVYGKRYNDLKPRGKAVYAAKLMCALGEEGTNPADFLICYSPDGREYLPGMEKKEKVDYAKLGTLSFYLRMCQSCGIPVYNFKNKDSLITFVSNYIKNTSNED